MNNSSSKRIKIIGAGLAGSELALWLAERGIEVILIDMKPAHKSPAHVSNNFAELVCSNSFRAASITNAVGLLKEEMKLAGSFIMKAAEATRIPAGGAWAVDREKFSSTITKWIEGNPNIQLREELITDLPQDDMPVVIATGPLTEERLARAIQQEIGSENLYFYDAIAPIISADSIDFSKVFFASRYGKGNSDDYMNIPLDEEQYHNLVKSILDAEKVPAHKFEDERYFEGCLPVEVMARRGEMTLAFGPLKPVGLIDPHTGKRPFAVIQLRKENQEGTAYNMVGFQTKMTYPEQRRIIRSLPGLQNAEILRYGSIHRNMFFNSPKVLDDKLRFRKFPHLRLAGQISGVEGYVESSAIGLLLAMLIHAELTNKEILPPPATTALGALYRHLRTEREDFQPSNVHFGMFEPMDTKLRKRAKKQAMAERAIKDFKQWLITNQIPT